MSLSHLGSVKLIEVRASCRYTAWLYVVGTFQCGFLVDRWLEMKRIFVLNAVKEVPSIVKSKNQRQIVKLLLEFGIHVYRMCHKEKAESEKKMYYQY